MLKESFFNYEDSQMGTSSLLSQKSAAIFNLVIFLRICENINTVYSKAVYMSNTYIVHTLICQQTRQTNKKKVYIKITQAEKLLTVCLNPTPDDSGALRIACNKFL